MLGSPSGTEVNIFSFFTAVIISTKKPLTTNEPIVVKGFFKQLVSLEIRLSFLCEGL